MPRPRSRVDARAKMKRGAQHRLSISIAEKEQPCATNATAICGSRSTPIAL